MKVITLTTRLFLKPYNEDRYWIIPNHIPDLDIELDDGEMPDIKDILSQWRDHISEYGYEISKTAFKHPLELAESDGTETLWYTGSTVFDDYHERIKPSTRQYIDIMVKARISEDLSLW